MLAAMHGLEHKAQLMDPEEEETAQTAPQVLAAFSFTSRQHVTKKLCTPPRLHASTPPRLYASTPCARRGLGADPTRPDPTRPEPSASLSSMMDMLSRN
jgi:hypothetical protein